MREGDLVGGETVGAGRIAARGRGRRGRKRLIGRRSAGGVVAGEAGEEGGAFGVEAGGEPVAQENVEEVASGETGAGESATERGGICVDEVSLARETDGVARRECDAEPAGGFVEDFASGGERDE